MKQRL
jgi:hypothetical protein